MCPAQTRKMSSFNAAVQEYLSRETTSGAACVADLTPDTVQHDASSGSYYGLVVEVNDKQYFSERLAQDPDVRLISPSHPYFNVAVGKNGATCNAMCVAPCSATDMGCPRCSTTDDFHDFVPDDGHLCGYMYALSAPGRPFEQGKGKGRQTARLEPKKVSSSPAKQSELEHKFLRKKVWYLAR
eukprot:m.12030 g.12030  ORF g.12030 m.12030 type:complete len:183 (-) comp4507_c1_seq1:128-676(-)